MKRTYMYPRRYVYTSSYFTPFHKAKSSRPCKLIDSKALGAYVMKEESFGDQLQYPFLPFTRWSVRPKLIQSAEIKCQPLR